MPSPPINFAVVGCGIAGCAASLLLARQGHRVTLFEQTGRVGPAGAGILLQPNGQRVLSRMGLLDAVAAKSARIHALVARTHRGRELSRLTYADHIPGLHAFGVHRGDLFMALHAAILAESRIDLRLGSRVDHFRNVWHPELLDDQGRSLGTFDALIVADGARSRLRETSGWLAACYHYEHAAMWVVGQSSWPRDHLFQVTRNTRHLVGLLPTGGDTRAHVGTSRAADAISPATTNATVPQRPSAGPSAEGPGGKGGPGGPAGRTSFFWGCPRRDWPAMRRAGFAKWRDEAIALAPEAEELLAPLNDFSQCVFASYRAVWMRQTTRGHVAFIGDAAHAASPLLGHGVNAALLDAEAIAQQIAGPAANQEDTASPAPAERSKGSTRRPPRANRDKIANAFATAARRRRWLNAYYSLLTWTLNPLFQSDASPLGPPRDLCLPWLQRIPPLKKLMLATLSGVTR